MKRPGLRKFPMRNGAFGQKAKCAFAQAHPLLAVSPPVFDHVRLINADALCAQRGHDDMSE